LTEDSFDGTLYRWRNRFLRQAARPYIAWKRRPRGSRAAAMA